MIESHLISPSEVQAIETCRTEAWRYAASYGLLEGPSADHEDSILSIAVFAALCAPPTPSFHGLRLATRLVCFFFYLDDAEPEALPHRAAALRACFEDPREPMSPQVRAMARYVESLEQFGDPAGFVLQFSRWLRALEEETQFLEEGIPSEADYHALRGGVVFVPEYLWTWIITEGIDTDPIWQASEALRNLAARLVYLANDLGSVFRDMQSKSPEPNLILIRAHERSISVDEARGQVVELYNKEVERYRRLRDRFVCETPAGLPLARLLDGVITGNVTAMRLLAEIRYTHSLADLEALEPVDEPSVGD